MRRSVSLGICAALLAVAGAARAGTELVGFAALPADTFEGSIPAGANNGSGSPISANGRTGPFPGQPVQGLSGVQAAPLRPGQFLFLSDNGFGAKNNSADFLLRVQRLRPRFRTVFGGSGTVDREGFIQLADPDHKISFPTVNGATPERKLTGADFDVESIVVAADGDLWIGDEFGPFLLHFSPSGRLLEAPISTPGFDAQGKLDPANPVRSPDNPLNNVSPNLGSSRGFEGMAYDPKRVTVYPLLEGAVAGDPANSRRIYAADAFGLGTGFRRFVGFYKVEDPAYSIGDFTPINKKEFLVIERDNGQGPTALFKKIFKIDIHKIDANGFVRKEEVVDLLAIDDPHDLNRDGKTAFTFPFQTIESVLVLSERTILVANDNNYPFSLGRGPDIDSNEMILLELDEKLRADPHID